MGRISFSSEVAKEVTNLQWLSDSMSPQATGMSCLLCRQLEMVAERLPLLGPSSSLVVEVLGKRLIQWNVWIHNLASGILCIPCLRPDVAVLLQQQAVDDAIASRFWLWLYRIECRRNHIVKK